jgi:hypothetical protein
MSGVFPRRNLTAKNQLKLEALPKKIHNRGAKTILLNLALLLGTLLLAVKFGEECLLWKTMLNSFVSSYPLPRTAFVNKIK